METWTRYTQNMFLAPGLPKPHVLHIMFICFICALISQYRLNCLYWSFGPHNNYHYIWFDIRRLLFFSLHYKVAVLLIKLKFCFENCSKSNVFWGFSEPNQFNKLINVEVRSEGDKNDNISQSKQKDEKKNL